MQEAQRQYVSIEEHQQLQQDYLLLKHQLEQLKRMIFGTKSERFVPDSLPGQLSLGLDIEQADQAPVQIEKISYDRKKHKPVSITPHGRLPIDASLPRRRFIIEPDVDTSNLKRIGEELSEELDYRPGSFWVNQYVRPKYAVPQPGADAHTEEQAGVVIAPMPSRPIEKGIPSAGLLGYILLSKTVDHLPLYRMGKMFERQGVRIPSATMTDWFKATCNLIKPLYEAQKRLVLGADYLQMDESPIKVLESETKGKTHRGYMWVCRAPVQNLVFFSYNSGRSAEEPTKLLKNFNGTLQSDGYSVYEMFECRPEITLAACLAHSRRKFIEAQSNDKARTEAVLTKIQVLYEVERMAKDKQLNASERLALRQELSRPIFDQLGEYLKKELLVVLPKSPIGKAIAYSLNRWTKLEQFLVDARVEIDTNLLENKIRPLALGRKNYLFAGNDEAAQRLAIAYSLMASCKINDINPQTWLRDVLFRLPDMPVNRVEELLPHNWKPLEVYPQWFSLTDAG